MRLNAALKLGRVSNLPTVWSNVLAGAALVNPDFNWPSVLICATAISCLYIAGMFLNDAFDFEWDREHRTARPIVTGEAKIKDVIRISIVLMVVALVLLLVASWREQRLLPVLLSAAALSGLILLYDWRHKRWSFSPWLMGGCRLLVYLTAAATVGAWNWQVCAAGACLLAYVAAITYLARTEHLNMLYRYWPVALLFLPAGMGYLLGSGDLWNVLLVVVLLSWLIRAIRYLLPGKQRRIPMAISALLAGIALIDTVLLTALQQHHLALVAAGAFALCLLAQRRVAAT